MVKIFLIENKIILIEKYILISQKSDTMKISLIE